MLSSFHPQYTKASEGLVCNHPQPFPTNQTCMGLTSTQYLTLRTHPLGHHPQNYCLTTRLLLFSQEEIIIALMNLALLYSPYYTVNDGINQVNNYGRKQGKTRVKQKIIFILRILSTVYITKFSTSFHPVDLQRAFVR